MIKDVPIWLTDWVVEYRVMNKKPLKHQVSGVVAKGRSKDEILNNKEIMRRVVWAILGRKTSRKKIFEVVGNYYPVTVELTKQVGYGVDE